MIFDVLVVGGGLSGMVIAQRLASVSNLHWKLLEARSVLGGRLANDDANLDIDLGGAWIWPEHQPKVSSLAKSLGIGTFLQPGDPESTRISGGAVQFIRKLGCNIPEGRIHLNTPVKSCSLVTKPTLDSKADTCAPTDNSLSYVEVRTTQDEIFKARHVVFAAPPKILFKQVEFVPPLNSDKQRAMERSKTWMAGVTKIALVYPNRFWDTRYANTGLPPGSGPAFQMYDSSTKDPNRTAALTFFTLVPSETPAYDDNNMLAKMVAQQLESIWHIMRQPEMAEQAHSYKSYHVLSWPKEIYLSEDDKPERINPHPSPVAALMSTDWNGILHFAGSEADARSPGVMEGAIGAAYRVLDEMKQLLTDKSS